MMLNHEQNLWVPQQIINSWLNIMLTAMLPPLVSKSDTLKIGPCCVCWGPANPGCQPVPLPSLHPFLPSCLCFFLSISLPHLFLQCLTNSFLPLPVFAVIFCCCTALFLYTLLPLMLRLYTAIRFQFHLDSLRIYFPSFIPAALPLRHSIHAFTKNRHTTQRRNPIPLLSVCIENVTFNFFRDWFSGRLGLSEVSGQIACFQPFAWEKRKNGTNQ